MRERDRLWLVVASRFIDPWGRADSVSIYRVLEGPVEVTRTAETTAMFDGYTRWDAPNFADATGRTWTYVQNMLDYVGGHWWRARFFPPPYLLVEPRTGSIHRGGMTLPIAPRTMWKDEADMKGTRLVNHLGQAVDIDGRRL